MYEVIITSRSRLLRESPSICLTSAAYLRCHLLVPLTHNFQTIIRHSACDAQPLCLSKHSNLPKSHSACDATFWLAMHVCNHLFQKGKTLMDFYKMANRVEDSLRLTRITSAQQDLTRFNKIDTQGAPQMAVDKEANSLSRVYSYYSKFNLRLFYV